MTWNNVDADADDDEEVEGGRADDCAGTETSGIEIVALNILFELRKIIMVNSVTKRRLHCVLAIKSSYFFS